MSKLKLKDKPDHIIARDIFLVGCYTAQRFSDYSKIRKDNIHTLETGEKVIKLTQQKTGERVTIPIHWKLQKILEKYNYKLPNIYEQKLNLLIKEVGQAAKINELVEIESIKGGLKVKSKTKKFNMIKTHTARRSGCTNMYLAGMAVTVEDKKFILINSSHPIGRQNFSICHELYHLYLDPDFTSHRCDTAKFDKTDKSEFDADSFASHFLLPEHGLLGMIPEDEWGKDKIKIETIVKIEQYFACSRRALANRLLFLKKISVERRDELCTNVKNSANQLGYPLSLYEPGHKGELWGDYGTLAHNLYTADKISEGHYASIMADIGVDIFKNLSDNDD